LEKSIIKKELNRKLDIDIQGIDGGGATWQNQILLLIRQGKLSSDFNG
jgi:hypothetical protein